MPILESTLSCWSHHQAGTASMQAHVSMREALDAHNWPSGVSYQVFLQGSYKNDTNLRRDSDINVVVRLASKLRPRVAAPAGEQRTSGRKSKNQTRGDGVTVAVL